VQDAEALLPEILLERGHAELLAAGADWIANDCASLRCTLIPGSDQLTIEFPDSEIPRLPKMS